MKKKSVTIKHDIHVLLHDIRSAHNVGAIFRTADAVGVSQIYLSGFTPRPLDRFGRPVREIAKTALGAEFAVAWKYQEDPRSVVLSQKEKGYAVIGIEQDERAIDYTDYFPTEKTLILMGSEILGLSQELRMMCDKLLEIPMQGEKESLNVSVAFGVAVFRLFDR